MSDAERIKGAPLGDSIVRARVALENDLLEKRGPLADKRSPN